MRCARSAPTGDTGVMDKPEITPRPRSRGSISVRTRIVAAITVVAALGLLAVGLSVYFVERQRILEQVDSRLHANLESARFLIAGGPDAPQDATPWASSSEALASIVQRMSPDDNTGVMGMADGVITVVPGVQLDLDLQFQGVFARHVQSLVRDGHPIIATYAEGDVLWRYLAAPIRIEGSPEPADVTFVMVYDVEAELDEINAARRVFLIASAITILLIAATGTIVATKLLHPLRQMRETADRVSAQSLTERLPIVGNDDVADLSETMNDMLDRLDDALESQRRLLSDVGHELKTPLTIVRGHLEVMDADDARDAEETRLLVVDELDRMGRLVQDLAAAASLHGPAPVQLVPVDTDDLLDQISRKATGIVGAEVTHGAGAHVVASLDPARITQAMLQLAQNAVTHGGGRLEIGSDATDSAVEFWVRDFGPGVSDAEKPLVFDRFHRGRDADGSSGSGLGLNIVQVIARAHGGSARVEDAPGGGARFVIRVPQRSTPLPGDTVIPPRPPLPTPTSAPTERPG